MATIRRRGKGWRAEICVQGVRQSATFDTRKQAEEWARATEASIDAGDFVDLRGAAEITLKELIERFIEDKVKGRRRTPASEQRETYLLNRLARLPMASLSLAQLTPVHFNKYRTERERVVAPATIRNELVAFRMVIQTAMDEWGVALRENPADGSKVKRPRIDNERDRILECVFR